MPTAADAEYMQRVIGYVDKTVEPRLQSPLVSASPSSLTNFGVRSQQALLDPLGRTDQIGWEQACLKNVSIPATRGRIHQALLRSGLRSSAGTVSCRVLKDT